MSPLSFHPNPIQPEEHKIEKTIFKHSLVFPTIFLTLLWFIKLWEVVLDLRLSEYGIYPLKLEGLKGIVLSPLFHGDWKHLMANSGSLFVLMVGLFYFYRNLAYKIFLFIYLFSGVMVWFIARPAWHLGASGVVYDLAAFLFLSGIMRKDSRLLSTALVVVFLYGGMFWGIFPIKPSVSWEGHLWGAIAGVIMALFYRKQGPKQNHFAWEFEEENEEIDEEDAYWMPPQKTEEESDNTTVQRKQTKLTKRTTQKTPPIVIGRIIKRMTISQISKNDRYFKQFVFY